MISALLLVIAIACTTQPTSNHLTFSLLTSAQGGVSQRPDNIHQSVWTLMRVEELRSHHEKVFQFDLKAAYGNHG